MIWIDAQLSPDLAPWLKKSFGLDAKAVREVGLREADDREIYESARAENAVVMTKDSDFVVLLDELGSPLRRNWASEVEEDLEGGGTRLIEKLKATSSHAVHVTGLLHGERSAQLLPTDVHVE